MNNIKELADEIWAEEYWNNPNTDKLLPAQLNKFAELIVRECVAIVENLSPGYNDYRNQIEDAFRGDCVGKIREHFGVEE